MGVFQTWTRDSASKYVLDASRIGADQAGPLVIAPILINLHGEMTEVGNLK